MVVAVRRVGTSGSTPWWRRVEQALGWSSLGFAVAGAVAPGLAGEALGTPASWSRALAARDAVLGVVLVRGGGPSGLALRALSDLGDAVVTAGRRPVVSAGALAVSALAAAAAVSAARAPGRSAA